MKIARRHFLDFQTHFGESNGMPEESKPWNLRHDNRIKCAKKEMTPFFVLVRMGFGLSWGDGISMVLSLFCKSS